MSRFAGTCLTSLQSASLSQYCREMSLTPSFTKGSSFEEHTRTSESQDCSALDGSGLHCTRWKPEPSTHWKVSLTVALLLRSTGRGIVEATMPADTDPKANKVASIVLPIVVMQWMMIRLNSNASDKKSGRPGVVLMVAKSIPPDHYPVTIPKKKKRLDHYSARNRPGPSYPGSFHHSQGEYITVASGIAVIGRQSSPLVLATTSSTPPHVWVRLWQSRPGMVQVQPSSFPRGCK